MPIQERMQRCQNHVATLLEQYLPPPDNNLASAMHYACLNGGKRIRPLLVYTTGELFEIPWERLDFIAAAIEMVHCYSLIHDDLPAMDNDDLRRGKPTCHKVFGEATAILAGDALLTLAFELLASSSINELDLLKIIKLFSKAAGANGMVLGQADDLAAEGQARNLEQLIAIHSAKTGALLTASVQCGALGSGHATEDDLSILQKFGKAIGLSFQIQDDILDVQGDSSIMGKNPGQDLKQNKCTFVTLLGLESARHYAKNCHATALACLEKFGAKADPLRALSSYIIERTA